MGTPNAPTQTQTHTTMSGVQRAPGLWLLGLASPAPAPLPDHLLRRGDPPLQLGRQVAPPGLSMLDTRVSGCHARICWDPTQAAFLVHDLGSRNGTFVNGLAVQRARLDPGGVLRIGESAWLLCSRADYDPGWTPPPDTAWWGRGSAAREVLERLQRAAEAELSVMLLGETGSGKEVAARELHRLRGGDGPFVVANCAEHDRNLLRSELFGHKRGSFTGADRDHVGLFVQAHGGTLFLDELGDLPLDSQGALLRAVELREVRAVGATQGTRVNVRIVSATNKDMDRAVGAEEFRSDLYYRLKEWSVHLPPLRARREDLPLLLRRFLDAAGAPGLCPAPEVLDALGTHAWPGNVRELRSFAARTAAWPADRAREALAELRARPEATSASAATAAVGGPTARAPMATPPLVHGAVPARAQLEDALIRSQGNVSAAARLLGTYPKKLYRWMDRLGLAPDTFRDPETPGSV